MHDQLITHGIEIPLQFVKAHGDAPLKRILMSGLGAELLSPMHIAIHEISDSLPFQNRDYSKKHSHNCDEWNIILGSENFTFKITLDDDVYEIVAPATVYIPKGIIHSANVLEGKGYYIAIVDTLNYNDSFTFQE